MRPCAPICVWRCQHGKEQGSRSALAYGEVQCNAGEVAYDHAIVQQAASLVRRLPAVKTSGFQGDFFKVGGHVLT